MPTLSEAINLYSGITNPKNGFQNDSRGNQVVTPVTRSTIYDGIASLIKGQQNDSKVSISRYQVSRSKLYSTYSKSHNGFQNDSANPADYTTSDSQITAMLRQQGIFLTDNYRDYQRLKRTPALWISPKTLTGTHEFVFITKPELNMYDDKQGVSLNSQFAINPTIADVNSRNPAIIRQLQRNIVNHESPFINILSNSLKNTLDVPNINSKEITTARNLYGTRITYRGNSYESDENQTFTLEFEETEMCDRYLFFKIWDIYNNLKQDGYVTPPNQNYIEERISHDKVAAYKIIVSSDWETIIFFAKFWGCYPDGAPRESFSETAETINHSVSWHYDFVDDMNPLILQDFNEVIGEYKGIRSSYKPLYDINNKRVNRELMILPYIVRDGDYYKLKWEG